MREQDSNKEAQQDIINEIVSTIISSKIIDESKKANLEKILAESKISDLTEFGRVVHAEMEAILSCSRVGISTVGTSLYCTTFPCHNCAKHIVDAGISRVVYVEPYPKSRALELHSDSISLKTSSDGSEENSFVIFEPFTGVGARRFLELFSVNLGNGFKIKRKNKQGGTLDWNKATAVVRTPLLPKSYIDIELAATSVWDVRSKN